MRLFNKDWAPRVEVRQAVRLTTEEYEKLEKILPNTSPPSTADEYAYRLGVQHALKVLREGFVLNDR